MPGGGRAAGMGRRRRASGLGPPPVAPAESSGKVSPMLADPGSTHADGAARPPVHEDHEDLIGTPIEALQTRAGQIRDAAHGNRITFSPKVFIPLTMLCRDRCGYCTFAKAPARVASPYLTMDQILG